MFKSKKIILGALIGALALSSTMIIANANNTEENPYDLPSFYNTSEYFRSNKHTNKVTVNDTTCPNYLEDDDKEAKTTSKGTWYYNKKDLSFKFVTNDGFVHSSKVTKTFTKDGEDNRGLNTTNYNLARSPLVISYFDIKNNKTVATEQGFYGTGREASKLMVDVDIVKSTKNGFEADILYTVPGIRVRLIVEFLEDSVSVRVPYNYIEETNPDYALASIKVYHYFGAVEKAELSENSSTIALQDAVTGYNFVPDGVGALVRYNQYEVNPPATYRKRVYGNDESVPTAASQSSSSTKISMPVFGYVQGENSNGCVAIIEDGQEFSDIVSCHPDGTINFYRTYPEFIYREAYDQKISSNSSISMIQKNSNKFDIAVSYSFLEGEDANYVGMAKYYREYLVNNKMMRNSHTYAYDRIPLRIDTIGNEVTEGVLFNKTITMTTFDEYATMLNTLDKRFGINNIVGVIKGYTKDGLTWTSPKYDNISSKLGSIESLEMENIYFHTDHIYASANQSGYNQSKDLANTINVQMISDGTGDSLKYMVTPEYTKERVSKDTAKLIKKGVKNFALDSIGENLHSNYGNNPTTRDETIKTYQEVVGSVNANVALYQPNDYLLKYTDRNFDYSMYTNQYLIFDDTVPFTSIVQSGSVELYSTYINFFGNVRDDLLRMIDYNVYPSFLLTKESSSLLDETALQYIYCSQYDNLESAVTVYYDFVNDALKNVVGAKIVDREVIKDGLVAISYSNGRTVYVNYTKNNELVDGTSVPAKGYEVI